MANTHTSVASSLSAAIGLGIFVIVSGFLLYDGSEEQAPSVLPAAEKTVTAGPLLKAKGTEAIGQSWKLTIPAP